MSNLATDLRQAASGLRSAADARAASRTLIQAVATRLGWSNGDARLSAVSGPEESIQITRGFVSGQPAAVFVAGVGIESPHLFDSAALYAYHASIPWGLVANSDGATVFNSHWIRSDDWFRLPPLRWDDLEKSNDILDAITPDGVTSGRIEHVATERLKPDRFLRPVDDALVERLDYWRSETLRYTKGVSGYDAKLQTLFAQLFVLRTVEDRKLAPKVPSLENAIGQGSEADVKQLRMIFELAQTHVSSELFADDAVAGIPPFVLSGIIHDLYHPRQLPREQCRYNFSWIDADVLGLAYEKYLSTVLTPAPVAAQLGLFRQPVREVERVSVRKAGGVYYTPPYITRFLAERCIDALWGPKYDPAHIPRIGDFACGSGSFLVAAADVLLHRLRAIDPARNWVHELISGRRLIGIDVDEKAVTMARLNLWTRFTEEPHPLPLPRLAEVIVHGDSLGETVWGKLPSEYDAILGNPPFLATSETPNKEDLAARFKTAQGRFDYSYLFVELAVRRLRRCGMLGLVVPNRLFRNRDASTIRAILTSETDLIAIVDFGSNEVFEGISAYVGTLVARKHPRPDSKPATSVRVTIVADLAPSFIGALLTRAHESRSTVKNDSLVAYTASHPRGPEPWLLLSEEDKRSRARLEEDSDPLPSLAGIYQGIRTGANDIFIGRIESGEREHIVEFVNALGEKGIVERSLLHPVVFGADIRRYDMVEGHRYVIYPYKNGLVIAEPELALNYPEAYSYLSGYRGILSGRGSIESSGLRWYELVRKRDESWLTRPKLLIRDLAIQTAFAIDQLGETFLVGGTAVVPSDPEMALPLLAYLNSSLVTRYLAEITPTFRGGFQKFEPQHLQRVPVPRIVFDTPGLANELERYAIAILTAHARGDVEGQRLHEQSLDRLLSERLPSYSK